MDTKGVIVYMIDVGQLPSVKAEALIDRVKDEMSKKKPDDWCISFVPVRNKGSKVQVFSLNENNLEEIKPLLMDFKANSFMKEQSEQQIKDYVRLMFGCPVRNLTQNVENEIDEAYDLAQYYGVSNHKISEFIINTIEPYLVVGVRTVDIEYTDDDE